jgi:hypothetical protein
MSTKAGCIAVACAAMALGACGGHESGQASLLATPTAGATAAPSTARIGAERMVLRLVDEQELSEAQRGQLQVVTSDLGSQWERVHRAVASALPAFRDELAKPEPDAVRLHLLVGQALDAHARMAHAMADEVLSLVTPTPALEPRGFATAFPPIAPAKPRDLLSALGDPDLNDAQKEQLRSIQQALLVAGPGPEPVPAAAVVESRRGLRPDRMALLVVDRDLDLTEAQQTALHALRHSRRVGLRVTDALIVAGEAELRSELGKPSPDAARVHAMVDQVLAPYQAMTHATVDRALAFHATLSASQLAALSQSSQSSE